MVLVSAALLALLSLGSCHFEVNPLRYFRHEKVTVKIGESVARKLASCLQKWSDLY